MNIMEARKQVGMTQGELAEKLGVPQPTIARYETGKSEPKLSTLKKIAEALGVDVKDILDENHSEVDIEASKEAVLNLFEIIKPLRECDIGDLLKKARSYCGMTQEMVGDQIGLTNMAICRIEGRGKAVTIKSLLLYENVIRKQFEAMKE